LLAGATTLTWTTLAASPRDNRPVDGGRMPELDGATQWLNSPALTAADLRGKVVLVDFWTCSCINWLRTASHVRAWAAKYKDQGLVVIGVHSPEFDFERNVHYVRRAVARAAITYPVAIDSHQAIWDAFRNNAWPALYFIDAEGIVRRHQIGEGNFDDAERTLQQLLSERGGWSNQREFVSVGAQGAELPADWTNLRSDENYLGRERTRNFASADLHDAHSGYSIPAVLGPDSWGLGGAWTIGAESIALDKPHGRIACRFHARDLHLVMRPGMDGSIVRFRVLIDGQPPGSAHGIDTDENGNGSVSEPRLYQLIRQMPPIDDRDFEIEFLDPGVVAYAFTFG
jgi:thiol-disulfide isomerase/thioredoxin